MRESDKKRGGKEQKQRVKYNKMEKVKGSVEGGTSCGRDAVLRGVGFSLFFSWPHTSNKRSWKPYHVGGFARILPSLKQ